MGWWVPTGITDEANDMMANDPELFKSKARNVVINAINKHAKGTYFFDYGNAFLLEASRAGATIMAEIFDFRYLVYVQDIMGPMCLIMDLVPLDGFVVQENQKI
jgi:urocanate hydratase